MRLGYLAGFYLLPNFHKYAGSFAWTEVCLEWLLRPDSASTLCMLDQDLTKSKLC